MSQYYKQKNLEKEKALISKILIIPILALLAIAPLVVRLRVVVHSEEISQILKKAYIADFFSQGKAVYIIAVSLIMLIGLFFLFDKKELKKSKLMLTYVIAAGVFFLFSLISALASPYRELSIWGLGDRAEGIVMIACYVFMFLYTIYAFRKTDNYKYIIGCLLVVIAVNVFLGAFQYFGKDLYKTEFVQHIIMPKEYWASAGNMESDYDQGVIYGTMVHYNYMGSFGAMMVPLFVTLMLFIKDWKAKIVCAVATVASLFLLFGSTSRAGLIGLGLAFVIGIILFAKIIIKKWKLMLPLVVAFIILLLGFNAVTKGTIFQRVPTLINDAFGLFAPSSEEFDYKNYIPIKAVDSKDGKVIITTQKNSITIEKKGETLGFYDAANEEVIYALSNDVYTTTDERFKDFSFNLIKMDKAIDVKDGIILKVGNTDTFLFRIDEKEGVYLVDSYTGQRIEIASPPTWGFKGKEKLGSARGYIWSRSIPMLKETLLIGYGPDVYVMKFPQRDYLGKYYAYDKPNVLVDKPHNLYLQLALNNGGIALIAFLIIVGAYIVDSIRLYAFKGYYESKEVFGIATSLSIIGYMGAALFNDSVVSVAPIFWILLGVGVALNYYENKTRSDVQKKLEHATIDIKTKKYVK